MWRERETRAADGVAAGINPYCDVRDARLGQTPQPLLMTQPPRLEAPAGKSVPVRLRRLLRHFYDTGNMYTGQRTRRRATETFTRLALRGVLAPDGPDPAFTPEFMGAPLAEVYTEAALGSRPLPVPSQLESVPFAQWPYPGPAWWRGPHCTTICVGVFVLRVNALILELQEQDTADDGWPPSTLAFALWTALQLHVRGAAALDTLTTAPPDSWLLGSQHPAAGDGRMERELGDAHLEYVLAAMDVWGRDGGPATHWPDAHVPLWWTTPSTEPFAHVLLAPAEVCVPPRPMPVTRAVVPPLDVQRRRFMQGPTLPSGMPMDNRVAAPEPPVCTAPPKRRRKASSGGGSVASGGGSDSDSASVASGLSGASGATGATGTTASRSRGSSLPESLSNAMAKFMADKLRYSCSTGKRYGATLASVVTACRAYLVGGDDADNTEEEKNTAVCGLGGALAVIRHALYMGLTGGYPHCRQRASFMTCVALDGVFNAPSCTDALLAWVSESAHDRLMMAAMTEFMHAQGAFWPGLYAAMPESADALKFYASAVSAMQALRASFADVGWHPLHVLNGAPASTWVHATRRVWAKRGGTPRKVAPHHRLQDALAVAGFGAAPGTRSWLPNDVPYVRLVFSTAGTVLVPKGVYDFLSAHLNQYQWGTWTLDDPVSDDEDIVPPSEYQASTRGLNMLRYMRHGGTRAMGSSDEDDDADFPEVPEFDAGDEDTLGGGDPAHSKHAATLKGMVLEKPRRRSSKTSSQSVLNVAQRANRGLEGGGMTLRRAAKFAGMALAACGVALPPTLPAAVLDTVLPKRAGHDEEEPPRRKPVVAKKDDLDAVVGRKEAAAIKREIRPVGDWAGDGTTPTKDATVDGGADGDDVNTKSGRQRMGRAMVHIVPVPLGTAKEIDAGVRAVWEQVNRQVPRDTLGTRCDMTRSNGRISVPRNLMETILKGTTPQGRSLYAQLTGLCVQWKWGFDPSDQRSMLAGLLGTLVRSMRRQSWVAEHAPCQVPTPAQEAQIDALHAECAASDERDVAAFVAANALLHGGSGDDDKAAAKALAKAVARMSGTAIVSALLIEKALHHASRCRVAPVAPEVWAAQEAAIRERYTSVLANGSRAVDMPRNAFNVLVCWRCRAVRTPRVTSAVSSYDDKYTAGPSMVGVLPCPECANIPSLRAECKTCDGVGQCLECATREAAAYVTKGCCGRDRSALTSIDMRAKVLHMDGHVYTWCVTCGVLFRDATANGSCWACNAQWMALPFVERRLRCMTAAEASAVARAGGLAGTEVMAPASRPRFCTVCSDPVENPKARFVWMAQPRLGADGKMQPLTAKTPAEMRLVWLCWKHSLRSVEYTLQLAPTPTPADLTSAATRSLGAHQSNLVLSRMRGRGRPRDGRGMSMPTWLRAASGMMASRTEAEAVRPFVTATATSPDTKEAQEIVLAAIRMLTAAWATPPGSGGHVTAKWNNAARIVATDPTLCVPDKEPARRRRKGTLKLDSGSKKRKKVAFAVADDDPKPKVRFADEPLPAGKRARPSSPPRQYTEKEEMEARCLALSAQGVSGPPLPPDEAKRKSASLFEAITGKPPPPNV